MSTIGPITATSFSNNPTAESISIDAYAPEGLQALNTPQPTLDKSLINLTDKIPPDELIKLQNDKELNARLQASGMSLESYIDNMENNLPRGLTLNQAVASGVGLQDIDKNLDRIKEGMANGDKDYKPSFVLSALKFAKNFDTLLDTGKYKELLDKAKGYGLDFHDEITESSIALASIEGLLSIGEGSKVWDFIEGTPLEGMYKRFIVDKGIYLSAKAGSYTACKSIIEHYGIDISNTRRAECINLLFENFRAGDEDYTLGYPSVAKKVVDAFNVIYPNWYILKSGSNSHVNHLPFSFGNDGILTLLTYYGANTVAPNTELYTGISAAALIQRDLHLKQESINNLVRQYQPNNLLDNPSVDIEVKGIDARDTPGGYADFGRGVING